MNLLFAIMPTVTWPRLIPAFHIYHIYECSKLRRAFEDCTENCTPLYEAWAEKCKAPINKEDKDLHNNVVVL